MIVIKHFFSLHFRFVFRLVKRQKESITTIENFPNELFYQIFSYLTDGKLFSSFYLLTKDDRFDELIRTRTSINLQSIRRLHSTMIN